MTESQKLLVKNMKHRRALLAISQMDLAAKLDISAGYVGEIEMGRKAPSLAMLERIAQALEMRPYQLLMNDQDLLDAVGHQAVYKAISLLKQKIDEVGKSMTEGPGTRKKNRS